MKLSRAVVSPIFSFLQKLLACVLIYALVGAETIALAAGPPVSPHGGNGSTAPTLSPQAIFQEAHLFYLKRGMKAALPLKLDPTDALPTIPNAQLPGGPFQGRALPLTAENVSNALPPGDYEIPVLAFCTQYSVHRPGQGAATTLAPVTGTQAETISNLLWRGTQAKIPAGRLQSTAWAIQAGVPYEHMSKQSQKDIDMFAPEGRTSVEHGFSIDAPVRNLYNDMVANPRKYILEYKHEKDLKFPDFLIPNIKIAAPSFDQLIAQAGPIGREYVRAELEQQAIQKTLNDQEHGQETLLLNQPPTDHPLRPSQGPWTVRVPNAAYMRFVVNGGNMQSNNVMQIRVLPTAGSYDDGRLQTPRLVTVGYQIIPLPAPITIVGLMGGGALATSQSARQKSVSSKGYGSSSLAPIIAFPSIPAQDLILVLPGLPLIPGSVLSAILGSSKTGSGTSTQTQTQTKTEQYRGRIQAQGGGLEASVSWAQDYPPSVGAGLQMLASLKEQLSTSQYMARQRGFEQAQTYIINAGRSGGVPPNTFKSFPLVKVQNPDIRVDIEVRAGNAFVADPAQ